MDINFEKQLAMDTQICTSIKKLSWYHVEKKIGLEQYDPLKTLFFFWIHVNKTFYPEPKNTNSSIIHMTKPLIYYKLNIESYSK